MKDLFCLVLIPVVIAITTVGVVKGIQLFISLSLKSLWRMERKKFRARLRGSGLRFRWMGVGAIFVFMIGVGLATGRPVFGLVTLPFIPLCFRVVLFLSHAQREQQMVEGSIAFFHTLHGLSQAGVALPASLFTLCERRDNLFSVHLSHSLLEYREGKSLQRSLNRFLNKNELGRAGLFLLLLETIYRAGLSVGPLLDEMVPQLEQEIYFKKRIRSTRRSVLAQAGVAVAVPFFLGVMMFSFQAELMNHFFSTSLGWSVLFVSLCCEALGVLVVWKISAFD